LTRTDIEALVFDFDGLILDTELPIYRAWRALFEAHGAAPPTIEEWAAEIGTLNGLDLHGLLVARATRPVDLDEADVWRRAHRDLLLAEEQARPGVTDWLAEADALGLGVAIASSSEAEWVLPLLERIGLHARFRHVVTSGGELRSKPAPDTYLEACARLGIAPGNALAIEDSPHGIAAAKAAGLRCVAVPHELTETLDLSAADLRLRSLADCTLSEALARLG
jgi:HAD superfamily hydrolase (TIGR01509 family)